VISESWYWKDTLGKHARALQKNRRQRKWPTSALVRLEERVMLSCYIVRKLAEASKLTTASYRRPVSLRRFFATGEVANFFNNHKIDELYKLDAGSDITKPLDYVLNQIIHSYVFTPIFQEPEKIYGFMFNSDRSKTRELYMVSLKAVAEIFASIASVTLVHRSYIRVGPSGEWKISSEKDAPIDTVRD
jgi:hypothetical protein